MHDNTLEGLWTGLRNFLRPFRGVNKVYLHAVRGDVRMGLQRQAGDTGFLTGPPGHRSHHRLPYMSPDYLVLDYCAAVRGILNDDQGGPLNPPGLRMAGALHEVQESIQRNLEARKGGSRRSNSAGYRDASRRAWTKSKSSKR